MMEDLYEYFDENDYHVVEIVTGLEMVLSEYLEELSNELNLDLEDVLDICILNLKENLGDK